jgi:O-antigen ligase
VTTALQSIEPRWLEALRLFVLHLLAISLFLAPAGVAAGLTLIWVWFVAVWLSGRPFPVQPIGWLSLAFALYCLLRIFVPATPVELNERAAAAFSWAQLVVFVPVAYAIGARERLVLRLLLLVAIGLVLGTLWRTDWAAVFDNPQGFVDSRPGFGFPALAYALYAGTALIGLVLLRRRCWFADSGRLRWWALLPWVVAVAVLAQAVVVTKARGSWMGLVVVVLIAVTLWWLRQRRLQRPVPRAPILIGAAALLLLIGMNAGQITDRLGEELGAAQQLFAGQPATEQVTSVGLRWHAQLFGVEQWLQRPWLGWGPGASRSLIADSGEVGLWNPEDGVLKHLHNSYLELLAQLGIVGFGLWMSMLAILLWGVVAAMRGGRLSHDLGWFVLFALLYLAIWSLFNFRMVNQDFRGYWAMLGGIALSFGLHRDAARPVGDGD